MKVAGFICTKAFNGGHSILLLRIIAAATQTMTAIRFGLTRIRLNSMGIITNLLYTVLPQKYIRIITKIIGATHSCYGKHCTTYQSEGRCLP